jgi:hypothetical protein
VTRSKVPRMIEGGIPFDHPSIRAALAEEEWCHRIMAVMPREQWDAALAQAKREGYEAVYDRLVRGEPL